MANDYCEFSKIEEFRWESHLLGVTEFKLTKQTNKVGQNTPPREKRPEAVGLSLPVDALGAGHIVEIVGFAGSVVRRCCWPRVCEAIQWCANAFIEAGGKKTEHTNVTQTRNKPP